MSTVFVVALLHGIPVFFLGVRTRSRLILTILAIISGAIALSTGNSRYNGADLTAVVLAWVLGMLVLGSIAPVRPRDENAERIRVAERNAGLKKVFVFFSVMCLAFVGIFVAADYYEHTQGPCSDAVLSKYQVSYDQCKLDEEIKKCRAGYLAACRSIEVRKLRQGDSQDPSYRW